jgi:hypothetical protein
MRGRRRRGGFLGVRSEHGVWRAVGNVKHDAQVQRQRGKEIYNPDTELAGDVEREKRVRGRADW